MNTRLRLRTISAIWVSIALIVGVVSGAFWVHSNLKWSEHLTQSYSTGVEVYYALESGSRVPGVEISKLSEADHARAASARFEQISDAPRPAYVTLLSLADPTVDPTATSGMKIAVASDQLKYRVAQIAADNFQSPALQFGELTRLLATYCSDPILYASPAEGTWYRIDGTAIWGCDAAPSDNRIVAALIAIITLAVVITQIGNTAESFESFSRQLRSRQLTGGPDSYETTGPSELADIVKAVNYYLEEERNQLSKRAIVLSGVSHDLGTPAARLRLRAALIEDPDMREKLEADIDQMTGIIESVLTYTQSELNSEEPRKLSLTSLVEALVADYQDTGQPVSLTSSNPTSVQAQRSVFAPRSGTVAVSDSTKLLMYARPVSLRRAIANLVDNALKYGRRATVSLEADSTWVIVAVEDEASDISAAELQALLAPFERGQNTRSISGFGLGLTIVATVARQHGGKIEFEDGPSGLKAKLWLRRT